MCPKSPFVTDVPFCGLLPSSLFSRDKKFPAHSLVTLAFPLRELETLEGTLVVVGGGHLKGVSRKKSDLEQKEERGVVACKAEERFGRSQGYLVSSQAPALGCQVPWCDVWVHTAFLWQRCPNLLHGAGAADPLR